MTAAGFDFQVHPVEVDERPRPGELPEVYVRRLAAEKSAAAWLQLKPTPLPILGADTAVVVDGEVLGKPRDTDEARSMLRRLAGRRHEVLTGLSLRRAGREAGRVELSAVFFAPLGDEEVEWYVQSGEGADKAGGYGIQGRASRFIRRIEGSYSNVVGLPVAAVYELLQSLGRAG